MSRALTATEYPLRVQHGPVMIWRSALDADCDYFNDPWLASTRRTLEQEMGVGWAQASTPRRLDARSLHREEMLLTADDQHAVRDRRRRHQRFAHLVDGDQLVFRPGLDGVDLAVLARCVDVAGTRHW